MEAKVEMKLPKVSEKQVQALLEISTGRNRSVGTRHAKAVLGLGVLVLALTGTALRANPVFSPAATEACVSDARATSPGLSGQGVLDCVGRAAAECMMTPGGDTTIGMIDCLDGELRYWDGRLNAAYAQRVKSAKDQDTEMRKLGSAVASLEESLRAMQRAWISFRNTSCQYEQAQWMGGTGGGPATAACHMQETAHQALKLEGWWEQ